MDVSETLDSVNTINQLLIRIGEKIESLREETPNDPTLQQALDKGSQEISRCRNKLMTIIVNVEKFVIEELRLKEDVWRVLKMKSELGTETYDCNICLSPILKIEEIWTCQECHYVLHLHCIRQYATTINNNGNAWKCPICRLTMHTNHQSLRYSCFCGKVTRPAAVKSRTAHGCGRPCQKMPYCPLFCHPAACPK